jgi:hypothetical protein
VAGRTHKTRRGIDNQEQFHGYLPEPPRRHL